MNDFILAFVPFFSLVMSTGAQLRLNLENGSQDLFSHLSLRASIPRCITKNVH